MNRMVMVTAADRGQRKRGGEYSIVGLQVSMVINKFGLMPSLNVNEEEAHIE